MGMSSLVLTADTLLGTPTVGSLEYDGKAFYGTPIGTQRGVVPNAQFYRLDSAYAGANATGAQGVFGVGTGGTGIGVTLSASTVYAFEAIYAGFKTAGITAHSIGFGFGGAATLNNIAYLGYGNNTTGAFPARVTTTISQSYVNTATNTQFIDSTSTAAVCFYARISGTVSVNAGGTFIPQYTLSAAPGGAYTIAAGSYFLIYPIGASGANTSVGTWA